MQLRKRDQARFDYAVRLGKRLQELQARGCLLFRDNVPVDPIVVNETYTGDDWVVAERTEGFTGVLVDVGYEDDGTGNYCIPSVDTMKEIRETFSTITYVETENIKKVRL